MLCWNQTHLSSSSCSSVQHITFFDRWSSKGHSQGANKNVCTDPVSATYSKNHNGWKMCLCSEICTSSASIFQRFFNEAPKLLYLHNEWADWKSSNNERLQKKKTNSSLSQSPFNKTFVPEYSYLVMKQKGWFLSYLKMRQQTVSQLKREIDLHLTLPKPVERSQVTYELSDLLFIFNYFIHTRSKGFQPLTWPRKM